MLMIREHNIVMLKITNILSTAMQLLISDHGLGFFKIHALTIRRHCYFAKHVFLK